MSQSHPLVKPRPRVLVVDDDAATRRALSDLLESEGREVVTASSGNEALRELLRREFAVVLLDVQMEGLDGFQTATLIRGRAKTRNTPIIFVTGMSDDLQRVDRAYATGAVDVVWKPIQPQMVRQKVDIFVELQEKNIALREAKQELERARKNLEVALESADGLVVVDRWNRVLYSNPAADRLFQRVAGSEDQLPCVVSRAGRRDCELPDGRVVELNTVEVDWDEPAFLATARDITYRKHMEAELKARNGQLETLFRVIGHDLRAPLRHIHGFADILAEDFGAQLGEEGNDYLRKVALSAKRMQQLLEDLMLLAKTRVDAQDGAESDAREVVDSVLNDLELEIDATGAEVEVRDLPARLPLDRRWASQVLGNLIGNALKYTAPGETPRVEVEQLPREGSDEVGLVVRDRGTGVPDPLREEIFTLFRRGTTDSPGTGAGLAIVREIALHHGGAAWVEPREGGGSEFCVTFAARA